MPCAAGRWSRPPPPSGAACASIMPAPPAISRNGSARARFRPRVASSFPQVDENSPAWQEGLRAEKVITHVDGVRVSSPKEFHAAVAGKTGPVTLRLVADGQRSGRAGHSARAAGRPGASRPPASRTAASARRIRRSAGRRWRCCRQRHWARLIRARHALLAAAALFCVRRWPPASRQRLSFVWPLVRGNDYHIRLREAAAVIGATVQRNRRGSSELP